MASIAILATEFKIPSRDTAEASYQIFGLESNGSNVCRRKTDYDQVRLYCCYNHYAKDGKCIECPNGSLSKNGGECQTCEKNTYGYQCRDRCNCKGDQRCNFVVGCISNDLLLSTETDRTSATSTGHVLSSTLEISLEEKTTESSGSGSKQTQFNILVIGGLIVILLLCIVTLQIIKKFKTETAAIVTNRNENSTISLHLHENEYDEIVDVSINESASNARNSYVSIVDEGLSRHSSSRSSNGSVGHASYLTPYEPMKDNDSGILHKNDNCPDVSLIQKFSTLPAEK